LKVVLSLSTLFQGEDIDLHSVIHASVMIRRGLVTGPYSEFTGVCGLKARACTFAPEGQLQPSPVIFNNDPSAGSPTETLLRLLLPLNDQV
jgi:hypothetical protein